MEDRLPRIHVFLHEAGDSGADLVEFEALDDRGVGHTIDGLLVVDPGRGEITAFGSHLLKDSFVDEELVFAAIAPAVASFLQCREQVVTLVKYIHNTRGGGQFLLLPKVRTETARKFFYFNASKLFNNIAIEMKQVSCDF